MRIQSSVEHSKIMARILIFATLLSISLALPQKLSFRQYRKPYSERIVGGSPVDIADYPYIVQLSIGPYFCGGSIISDTWILTAGHCLTEMEASTVTVRAGSASAMSGGVSIAAAEVYVHPLYNEPSWWTNAGPDYDVALIKLTEPLTFSSTISSIPLIDEYENVPTGSTAWVAGWGVESEDGVSISSVLRAVSVPIVAHNTCQNLLDLSEEYFTSRMLCAAYDEGGKDACQGDSGGPLVVDNVLVGIVSWGRGCARAGQPGVYSDVSNLREYIRSITSL